MSELNQRPRLLKRLLTKHRGIHEGLSYACSASQVTRGRLENNEANRRPMTSLSMYDVMTCHRIVGAALHRRIQSLPSEGPY
jgi:hypothetical protein